MWTRDYHTHVGFSPSSLFYRNANDNRIECT